MGDFSVVVRQSKIMGKKDAWTIYRSLARESELKADKINRAIGF